MERKLYDASLGGNVTSLMELLEEDPLVIDRVITGFYENPLHIAAMRGHVNFAAKLVSIKPDLTSELDSSGFCPLHLASTKKNVEMVKVLLQADPDACSAIDQDGRTPLHLAAMKGRVEIMKVLIQTQPEAIQVLSDRRETILHLCVKHNRLEALKLLVEHLLHVYGVPIDGQEESNVSVNSKDNDGNTILHLAVARRQMKMIRYLLDSNIGIELNALNSKGFTALDILTHSIETRGLKDIEIEDLLRDAGVLLRASRQQLAESEIDSHDETEQPPQEGGNTVGRKKFDYYSWHNALIVTASLIATMGFQAGTNPVGGVWQGSGNDDFTGVHENIKSYGSPSPASWDSSGDLEAKVKYTGTSVMAYIIPPAYYLYMCFNTIGFMASLSVILLLISGLRHVKRKVFVGVIIVVLWLSITCMALTYIVAVITLLPLNYDQGTKYYINPERIDVTILVWVGLIGLVLLAHFIHWIKWLLRKLGILKQGHGIIYYISWLPKKLGILKQEEPALAYVRHR